MGFVCEFGKEGRGRFEKKMNDQVGEIEENERGGFGGLAFLQIQNPPHLEELKNCIGGGFWRINMNSSNLIYVVIIFLKLKI